jgi:hypothetical protein
MVVVEKASDKIGKTVEIEFIRSLQTAAGKMMFAKLTEAKVESNGRRPIFNRPKPTTKPITHAELKRNNQPRQNTKKHNSNPGNSNNQVRENHNNRVVNKSAQQEQNLINLVNKQ